MLVRSIAAIAVATAALVSSPSAAAGEYQTFAAGACKSALPAFDGNIRSRPLAVQNEGTANAFVTCAQQGNLSQLPTLLAIVLVNNTAAPVTINCTLVSSSASPTYFPVVVSVPANSSSTGLTSPTAPATSFTSGNAAWSCGLPPGTGISRVAQVRPDA